MTDESEPRRDFSQAERDKMAKAGTALPDGSFPIANVSDLKNAISAYGRAGNKAAAKAHIIKRAKALGRSDLIPEEWRAFEPGEPDADNMGGPDDGDSDTCSTCGGSGETDMGQCPDCQGSGSPKGESMMGGPTEGNSAIDDAERRANAPDRLRGTIERRSFSTDGAEIRSTADGGLRFSGYASTTETPYTVGGFEETFAKGAFKRCLNSEPDVCFLVNHEGLPLARTTSGTLTLTEDSRGLKVDADLDPSDPDVQAILPKMKRGDLTEMSFAFKATDDEWSDRDTKRLVRSATIHKGDVSVVTRGANGATYGSIRALVEDFEQRAGKQNSKKDRTEIEEAIEKLKGLLAKEETQAEAEVQAQTEGELKISVLRSELDVARAKRARLGRTA
jgi:HK97 family phage prohead protease